MNKSFFAQKLAEIKSQIRPNTHLLLVSKTRSVDEISSYYDLGQRDFGENKVQELLDKSQHLKIICPDIRWHMIGNLQSNKINQLYSIPSLWAIHSVGTIDLLVKLLKAQHRLDHEVNIFLQYNTSKEEEKSGFEDYESLKTAADLLSGSEMLKIKGLMTMGTLRTENFSAEAGRCFRELSQLKDRLAADLSLNLETSMGMSQDFKIAIEEQSNWIRLGTTMFE